MSWVSHDLEPYVIQRYMGKKVAFVPLLIGSYAPDLVTKWFVYGVGAFGVEIGASDPAQFHRGFPGAGFTHSPFFGVVMAGLIYLIWRNKLWALSFLIGLWAHAFTDLSDTLGVMLAFPFSTHIYSIGLWPYAAEAGRLGDAAAYFSGPALVWDFLWVVLAIASWRVLTKSYFREVIAPTDPFWGWAGRRLPEVALLALYRTSFFYGIGRWVAWILWVHVINSYAVDISWGGPHWQPGITSRELNGGGTSWQLLVAAIAISLTCLLTYLRISGHGPTRLLWRRLTQAWAGIQS
jgi:hypothetical protein